MNDPNLKVVRSKDGPDDVRYEVWYCGEHIGRVTKGWFRKGGWGYTHNHLFGHPTLKAAVRDLVKKHWQDVARQADALKLCE